MHSYQNAIFPCNFDPATAPFVFYYDNVKQSIFIQKLYTTKNAIGRTGDNGERASSNHEM